MTDELKNRSVDQFIKGLDPSKTILMQSDVSDVKEWLKPLVQNIQSGDCHALEKVSRLILERAQKNEKTVRKILGPTYKVDDSVELVIDPKKRNYFSNDKDQEAVLTGLVHFQVASLMQAKIKLDEAKKQVLHRYELTSKRAEEKKLSDYIEEYAEAFASSLDPHSSFLPQDDLEDLQIQMQLSLEGIGASLSSQNGFTVIEELIPGGAAEKSKLLRVKDKIIAVAQQTLHPVSVIDMDLRDVVKLIRGKKGTTVKLTILRQQGDSSKTIDVAIVRDKIDIQEQAAKIIYEDRKIGEKTYKLGIIDLPSFYGGGGKGGRSSSGDVKKLLVEAKAKKVDGIILNLTRNGGGILDDAVKISGLFIKKGAVVATKNSDGVVEVLRDDDDSVVYNGPLAVLVSRFSASASEILAGALKSYKRAVIIGSDHTFGKGSVQALSPLPLDLGAMKVTTGMFFLPAGPSTQHSGVKSDIMLPQRGPLDDVGEKTLDYSLPPQVITAFVSPESNSSKADEQWLPLEDKMIETLAQKSVDRVKKEQKFKEIEKETEENSKSKDKIKLSELLKKSEQNKKKGSSDDEDDTPEARRAKIKDMDSPYLKEAGNIIIDLITLKTQLTKA